MQLQRLVGNRSTTRLLAGERRPKGQVDPSATDASRRPGRVLHREKVCVPGNEGSPECLEWEHDKAASQQSKNYSDLKPADDALHGVAPFYMVTDQLSPDVVVDPDYTFQFSDWLMVPYMPSSDCGVPGDEFSPPGPVIYILAWNPTTHRNELAIGPNELQTVLTHEADAKTLRNRAYLFQRPADEWQNGQPSADEVYLAKAFMALNNGDVGKALKLWGKAWVVQAKNPMSWVNVMVAYGGAAKGPGPGGSTVRVEPEPATIPESSPAVADRLTGPTPAVSTAVAGAEPRVELPNGQRVGPDSYSGGFYGTADERPDVVMRDGLPQRGDDWRLREHSEGNPNSALRGTTNILSDGEGRGAAYWAREGGYVYEIRRVPHLGSQQKPAGTGRDWRRRIPRQPHAWRRRVRDPIPRAAGENRRLGGRQG